MDRKEIDRWFKIEHSSSDGISTITIRMAKVELMAIAKALASKNVMAPICEVVDASALGEALAGSTFCAGCRNPFGEIAVSHQFSAKNWVSAWATALWHCKGSFQLVRGTCGNRPGRVIKH